MNLNETGINGWNCFHHAAYKGKIEIMRFLNSKNSELKNHRDNTQKTAFNVACFSNVESVKFLIEEMKININQNNGQFGRNCFRDAASRGKTKILKYLKSINPDLKYVQNDNHQIALANFTDRKTIEFLTEFLNF